jgi:hypothetical protein
LQIFEIPLVSFFVHFAGVSASLAGALTKIRSRNCATLLEELGQLANETANKGDRVDFLEPGAPELCD